MPPLESRASFIDRVASSCLQAECRAVTVLVAVSGGADSVALLQALTKVAGRLDLQLVVAHYNHRVRGEAADTDAEWVEDLARRLGWPVSVEQAPEIPAELRENAAREERYAFLKRTAAATGATVIVTGHTRNDLVETVLHHLVRGTGITGLQGIPASRVLEENLRLVRPLLDVSREEILQFLTEISQDYRTDATNIDQRWTRNWVRHAVWPVLQERYPQGDEAIARLARQAAETTEVLRWTGQQLLNAAVTHCTALQVELGVTAFLEVPRAAIREACVELWRQQGWPLGEMSYNRWNALVDLIFAPDGCRMFPGGVEARRRGQALVLRRTLSSGE